MVKNLKNQTNTINTGFASIVLGLLEIFPTGVKGYIIVTILTENLTGSGNNLLKKVLE